MRIIGRQGIGAYWRRRKCGHGLGGDCSLPVVVRVRVAACFLLDLRAKCLQRIRSQVAHCLVKGSAVLLCSGTRVARTSLHIVADAARAQKGERLGVATKCHARDLRLLPLVELTRAHKAHMRAERAVQRRAAQANEYTVRCTRPLRIFGRAVEAYLRITLRTTYNRVRRRRTSAIRKEDRAEKEGRDGEGAHLVLGASEETLEELLLLGLGHHCHHAAHYTIYLRLGDW